MDRADTTKTAPPDAPVSVQTLQLQTVRGARPSTNESVVATLALYPNKPVVTLLNRVISYPDGAGPNFGQILDAIRAKFGPATETQVQSDSANLKMQQLTWHFDRNGKALPPVAAYTLKVCAGSVNQCPDLSAFVLVISASGSGMVTSMTYQLANGPLFISAEQATDAYLQSVEDNRTLQQNNESKNRPLPKL